MASKKETSIAKEKALSFEDCFEKLEKASNSLKSDDLTLEESYNNYKEGMEYYETCQKMLDELKQKIQVYDRRLDELKEVE